MTKTKDEIAPANARTFGSAVRKTLKALGLDWRVKCQTVSFSGFGYGSSPFAEIATERKLTVPELKVLADCVRAVRALPEEEGGGKGIIQLAGKDYGFGGSIGHADYLVHIPGKTQEELLKLWFDNEPAVRSPYASAGQPPMWLTAEQDGYTLYTCPCRTSAPNDGCGRREVDGLMYQFQKDGKWAGQGISTTFESFLNNGAEITR